VTYTSPDGDKLFFRKSFKFMISNPLAVKTKVYNVEVLLQCTHSPLFPRTSCVVQSPLLLISAAARGIPGGAGAEHDPGPDVRRGNPV
jgi:hypothetical protein